jgi:hypothetical protein
MDANLAAVAVPKADPTDKIMVFSILTLFFFLSALTSALPSPDPLDQTGDPSQQFLNNGDASWVLTSSALVFFLRRHGRPQEHHFNNVSKVLFK